MLVNEIHDEGFQVASVSEILACLLDAVAFGDGVLTFASLIAACGHKTFAQLTLLAKTLIPPEELRVKFDPSPEND
ncbi:hypothetical protein ASD54_24550 [Rhizobium sp. Root149]|nr:hypothetical protein ASD54_24550 [Rhizobium sp. Root149]